MAGSFGALKKQLGLCITSELSDGRGRVYRVNMREARLADAAAQSPKIVAPGGDQQVDQSHPGDIVAGAA